MQLIKFRDPEMDRDYYVNFEHMLLICVREREGEYGPDIDYQAICIERQIRETPRGSIVWWFNRSDEEDYEKYFCKLLENEYKQHSCEKAFFPDSVKLPEDPPISTNCPVVRKKKKKKIRRKI